MISTDSGQSDRRRAAAECGNMCVSFKWKVNCFFSGLFFIYWITKKILGKGTPESGIFQFKSKDVSGGSRQSRVDVTMVNWSSFFIALCNSLSFVIFAQGAFDFFLLCFIVFLSVFAMMALNEMMRKRNGMGGR